MIENKFKQAGVLALVLAGALTASACGIRGDLERPPPAWGEDLRTDDERAHENNNPNGAD